MEFSRTNKILSLIFPVITVLFGVITLIGGLYHPLVQRTVGAVIIAAGIVLGMLILKFKIDTSECLKVQTITILVLLWLHLVTANVMVMTVGGGEFDILGIIYTIFYLAIDLGAAVIMMFNLPHGIGARKSLVVLFSHPVVYMVFNRLMNIFADFLDGIGLLD